MQMDDAQLILERDSAWELMSPDERLLLAWMWRRILKVGRETYGPLDMLKEQREFVGEAVDELGDAVFYLFCESRRLEMKKERVSAFVEAIDDEPTGKYTLPNGCAYCRAREGELHDVNCTYLKSAFTGPPPTWAAELGEPPIEIAIARTDSAEFENTMSEPCGDCAAPPGTLHRSGCEWTIVVPLPDSEVA